jgi:hypothetical protein
MAATYTDNGTNTPNDSHLVFSYSFPVLKTEDVKVALNGVTQATTKYAVDNTSNPTKITFNNTNVDSTVQESTGAPKTGVIVRVYRETTVGKTDGNEDPKAVFAAGSSIRAGDLNNNQEQALFGIHELQEKIIQTEDIADDAITSAKLDTNIDIAGTLDVTGNTTLDGTLASGATTVTGNISVSGTVDGRDVAADGSKLDGIDTGAKDDQTAAEIRVLVESASDSNVFTDADHSKLNAIEASATADQTGAEIKTAYEAESNTNAYTDAEKTKLSGIATGAEVNVQSDWNASSGDAQILNKPSVALTTGDTFTGDVTIDSGGLSLVGLTVNNVRVGKTGAEEIDTSSGNLTLDSAGGYVIVDDHLKFTGHLWADDDKHIVLGDAANLEIYFSSGGTKFESDGTTTIDSTNTIFIKTTGNSGNIEFDPDGSGKVLVTGPLETTGDITVGGDIKVGTAAGTANQYLKKSSSNALAWETVSPASAGGANTIHMNDDVKLTFGDTTTPDLEIYHQQSDTSTWIDSTSGDLYIRNSNDDIFLRAADDIHIQPQGNDDGIHVKGNAGVRLFYAGAGPYLETTASGAKVTGNLGIGTTATASLDVRRSDADGKIAEFHQSTGYGIDIGSSATDAYISSGYSQNFIFKTDAGSGQVEAFRLNSDGSATFAGNVGIGAAALSSYALGVYSADGAGVRIKAGDEEADIALSVGSAGTADKFIITSGGDTTIKNHLYVKGDGTANKFETTASGAKVTGKLLIDTDSRALAGQGFNSGSGWGGTLQIEKANPSEGNNYVPFVGITAWNGADQSYTGGISFNRSGSNTQGTHATVNGNKQLGNIAFNGSDGTNFIQGAEIYAIPEQAFATNDGPTALVFGTVPGGTTTTTPVEALKLTSTQNAIFSGYINLKNSSGNEYARIANAGGSDLADVRIYSSNGGTEYLTIEADTNGAAHLFYGGAGTPSVSTTAAGCDITGTLNVKGTTNGNGNIYAKPNGTAVYGEFKGFNAAGDKSCGMTTWEGSAVFIDSSNNASISLRANGTGDIDLQTGGSSTLMIDDSKKATFAGAVSVASKTVSQTATPVGALNIDCATGNYFTKAIITSSTFTFSNVPASGTAYGFVLEVDVTGSNTMITWPNNASDSNGQTVYWPGAGVTAPTLTDTKTHVFTFATVDGGTTWRASSLVDYTT